MIKKLIIAPNKNYDYFCKLKKMIPDEANAYSF